MARIFISYRSTDREFVLQLAKDLRTAGYEVWVDQQWIVGDKPYWQEIQSAIEECSHFLFVISPESIENDSGAMKELYHAAHLRPSKIIVPVIARETPFSKIPLLISPGMLQIHDFTKFPYQDTLNRVIRALQADSPMLPTETQKQRVMASELPPRRRRIGDVPNGWAIIIGAILTGIFVIVSAFIQSRNNNEQTQTAAVLTQTAPTATVITATSSNTDTLTPNASPTEIPATATFTLTTAPTATDTTAPTNTDTPHPTATETSQPTIDLVAIDARTRSVQRTGTAAVFYAQQTTDAIFAAEDNTATANAIASFTKTPIPTSTYTETSTPTPIPTIAPTSRPTEPMVPSVFAASYPCPARIIGSQGNLYTQLRAFPNDNNRNGIRGGTEVTLRGKSIDGTLYHLFDKANVNELGWIPLSYVELSDTCPK